MKHWFFTNSESLTIWTYGSENHPSNTHKFQTKKDFDQKVKALIADGYEFIRDQAKS